MIAWGLAASPAHAGWTLPQVVSGPDSGPARDVSVAVGADGTTAAVWKATQAAGGLLSVATAAPGAPFVTTSLGESGQGATVAVGPQGQVLVAWYGAGIRVAYSPPGGPLEAPRTVGPDSNVGKLAAGFDSAGNATVAWTDDPDVKVAGRSSSGTWSAAETISASGGHPHDPILAVAPGGDTAVAWSNLNAASAVALRDGFTGAFTRQDVVTSDGSGTAWPERVLAASTGAMTMLLVSSSDSAHTTTYLADRPAGGAFGAPVAVGPPATTRPWAMVGAPSGALSLLRCGAYEGDPMIARDRPSGGVLGDEHTIGGSFCPWSSGGAMGYPDAAEDDGGTFYALGTGNSAIEQQPTLQAATRSDTGTLSAPTDMWSPDGWLLGGTIAAGGAGKAAIGWTAWDNPSLSYRVAIARSTSAPSAGRPTVAQPAGQPQEARSTSFQADSAHSGNITGAGLDLPLHQGWSVPEYAAKFYAVIDDGRAFFVEYDQVAGQEVVEAVDLANGAELWRHPDPQATALAARDGSLYVAAGSHLQALSEQTGQPLWDTGVSEWYLGDPVIRDGVVYVTGSGQGGNIYALRASDGSLLWRDYTDITGDAVVGNGTVMAAGPGGDAEGWDATTGNMTFWHWMNVYGPGQRAAFDGRFLWSPAGQELGHVFDTTTGAPIHGLQADAPPAILAPLAFFVRDGALLAVDDRTFQQDWRFAPQDRLVTEPLVVDDVLYVGASSGVIYALDPATGDVRWSANLGEPIRGTSEEHPIGLAAGDGHLLVPTQGHFVDLDTAAPAPALAPSTPTTTAASSPAATSPQDPGVTASEDAGGPPAIASSSSTRATCRHRQRLSLPHRHGQRIVSIIVRWHGHQLGEARGHDLRAITVYRPSRGALSLQARLKIADGTSRRYKRVKLRIAACR